MIAAFGFFGFLLLGNAEDLRAYSTKELSFQKTNQHYLPNRAPLNPNPLTPLPIGKIAAREWLDVQLRLLRDGFFGNLPKLSSYVNEASGWWNREKSGGEELPYWLRGYGDLGYVLKDLTVQKQSEAWLEKILSSQDESGYFGPKQNKLDQDYWPNMLVLQALRSFYESSSQERVLTFITRYFRFRYELAPEKLYPVVWKEGETRQQALQQLRAGDELEMVYWLYNRTGESWLLDLAKRIHERSADWSNGIPSWNGVHFSQGLREPALFSQQSRDAKLISAVSRNWDSVYNEYGQMPGGMFAADANCRKGYTGAAQGSETCAIVEMMRSLEQILQITGNPVWADRFEEIAFNSYTASLAPDLRSVHAMTAANLVLCDRGNKAPGVASEGPVFAFDPRAQKCCQHNVGIGWPGFTEKLWFATGDNGIAALLYAPSVMQAKVGDGTEVTIVEKSEYPFEDKIEFSISINKPTRFPLALRIPGWCETAQLSVNGNTLDLKAPAQSFAVLENNWKDGDRIVLSLPMSVRFKTWEKQNHAVSVYRGPLAYSLRIPEKWVNSDDTSWPSYELFADGAWNYALSLDERDLAHSFEVIPRTGIKVGQRFHWTSAPWRIKAKGYRLPDWKVDSHGMVGALPVSPVSVSGEAEEIFLIPMGCTRLRISVFPLASQP